MSNATYALLEVNFKILRKRTKRLYEKLATWFFYKVIHSRIQPKQLPRIIIQFLRETIGSLTIRPKWGWHLNISVTSSDFRPLPRPFVLYVPWRGGSFLSLGLGQPWPCLDLLPLLPLLFGIAFHLQLVLLSCHPIFLRPYH